VSGGFSGTDVGAQVAPGIPQLLPSRGAGDPVVTVAPIGGMERVCTGAWVGPTSVDTPWVGLEDPWCGDGWPVDCTVERSPGCESLRGDAVSSFRVCGSRVTNDPGSPASIEREATGGGSTRPLTIPPRVTKVTPQSTEMITLRGARTGPEVFIPPPSAGVEFCTDQPSGATRVRKDPGTASGPLRILFQQLTTAETWNPGVTSNSRTTGCVFGSSGDKQIY
jgi:hypothetical protein